MRFVVAGAAALGLTAACGRLPIHRPPPDAMAPDPMPQDAMPPDATPQDATPQDATPQDATPQDLMPHPERAWSRRRPSLHPYPTEFHFRNDTAAPLFINKNSGCAGIEYGVSSCASGFRDRLGPTFHCACSCDESSCTGPPNCGACPAPEGMLVPAGASVAVPWDGVQITDDEKPRPNGGAPFSCVRLHPLAAGRYRVAIRVFDDQTAAAAAIGGRTVTRDFELPNAGNVVDVPLAATALDRCDPAPDAATPICTGTEARDAPCSLAEPLGFAFEGGLGLWYDSSGLAPPATFARRRVFTFNPMPDLNCSTAIPRCARDSRVVTTADLARVAHRSGRRVRVRRRRHARLWIRPPRQRRRRPRPAASGRNVAGDRR